LDIFWKKGSFFCKSNGRSVDLLSDREFSFWWSYQNYDRELFFVRAGRCWHCQSFQHTARTHTNVRTHTHTHNNYSNNHFFVCSPHKFVKEADKIDRELKRDKNNNQIQKKKIVIFWLDFSLSYSTQLFRDVEKISHRFFQSPSFVPPRVILVASRHQRHRRQTPNTTTRQQAVADNQRNAATTPRRSGDPPISIPIEDEWWNG
jgi:hypothetical protein